MQQAAICSLFFSWGRNGTRALGVERLHRDCRLARRLVQNFTAALFRWEEVASFLKHMETKRKWAVCSSLLTVVSFFFFFLLFPSESHQLNGNYRWLPICSEDPGPAEVALTLQYPGGERRELSKLTPLPCSCGEVLLQLLPHGASAAHSR